MVSGDITLVGVPIGPRGAVGAPTPIVSFAPAWWSLRPDGSALAVSVSTGQTERTAVWDALSGSARWLSGDEPGASAFAPMWSRDGASLFYVGSGADGKTAIFRIGADGAGKKQIPGSDGFAGSLQGLTPDGGGLVWSRGQAGGSAEVLDMATGLNRHLENNARVQSWRARQPRALLEVGGCCAGRPGGELVLWDDVALTSRVVAARGPSGDPAWGVATWDPGGTRIAAVRFDSASPYEGTLVGINSVVMNGARIGRHTLIGANTLIAEGKEIPDGVLVLGSPGKVVRDLKQDEKDYLLKIAQGYIDRAKFYKSNLKPM